MERARGILDGFDSDLDATQRADDAGPSDPESLDQLFHELEAEQAARQEQLEQSARDVDEEMRFVNELLASTPSPPRAEEIHSAVDRVRSELHDERAQFETAHFSLVNEYAYVNTTLGPDSAAGTQRMAAIQAKIQELELSWQTNTQKRLDETRRLLRDMQGFTAFRDEAMEAELAQQLALLEHELAHPPFGPR